MGLLATLNLRPRSGPVPGARAAMPKMAGQPAPMSLDAGPPSAAPPYAVGSGPALHTPDLKNLDEFFPVTLNGKTKEMIAKELEDAKLAFGEDVAQVQSLQAQYEANEKKLAPLAKTLEEMMKTPAAKLGKDIQENTNGPMVNIARRAQTALNQRNTAATLLQTIKDLADRSKSEVEEVAKRLKAAADLEKAAGLREEAAKITEAFEFFEKVLDVGLDLVAGDELAVVKSAGKLALWAGKAASGADALIAQAAALEKSAKELQDEALKQQSQSVSKLFRSLGNDAKRAQKDLAASDKALEQDAGDAQHAYDTNKNRKNKSAFKFSDFAEGVKLGAATLALLDQTAGQLQSDMKQMSSYGNDLGALLNESGKCLSHHDQARKYPDFKPDPMVVMQKTAELKAQVKAALVDIVAMKKQFSDRFEDVAEGTAFLRYRQQQWEAYYAAAQDALYSAPERG